MNNASQNSRIKILKNVQHAEQTSLNKKVQKKSGRSSPLRGNDICDLIDSYMIYFIIIIFIQNFG